MVFWADSGQRQLKDTCAQDSPGGAAVPPCWQPQSHTQCWQQSHPYLLIKAELYHSKEAWSHPLAGKEAELSRWMWEEDEGRTMWEEGTL